MSWLMDALATNRKVAATRDAYGQCSLGSSTTDLDRLAAANLRFTAGYYARYVGLLSPPRRLRLRRTIKPAGDEALRAVTAQGRGAVLLAVHLGDFDLAGHWVAHELGRQLVVASPPIQPAWRGDVYRRLRQTVGFDVRQQDQTTLHELVDEVSDGKLVLFLADRRPPGRALPVRFLGRPSVVSAVPSWLSARTGVPILTAATFTEGAHRTLVFGQPRWADRVDDHRWIGPALAELETAIRAAPHQWHIPAERRQLAVHVDPYIEAIPEASSALRPAEVARPHLVTAGADAARENYAPANGRRNP